MVWKEVMKIIESIKEYTVDHLSLVNYLAGFHFARYLGKVLENENLSTILLILSGKEAMEKEEEIEKERYL